MRNSRREVLLLSASTVALCWKSGRAVAQSLHPENQAGAEALYGTKSAAATTRSAQLLLQFQQERTAAPRGLAEFGEYLRALPLTQKMGADIASGEAPDDLYYLLQWNHHALDLLALDHTKYVDDDHPVDLSWAEQVGPHRSSRALAIIQIAMAEAVNFVHKTTQSYKGIQNSIATLSGIPVEDASVASISVPLAITWAAYGTMVALFPHKQGYIKACLSEILHVTIKSDADDVAQQRGTLVGKAAAHATLAVRAYDFATGIFHDGSRDGEQQAQPGLNSFALEPTFAELFPNPTDADWKPDPISQKPKPVLFALGGHWSQVDTFVVDKTPAGLFLPPGPPSATSKEFIKAYGDVRIVGGDGQLPPDNGDNLRWRTPTSRNGLATVPPFDSNNESFKADYWGYDATAYLCAPPRLYLMIATSVALNDPTGRFLSVTKMARYLAIMSIALADAGIAAWTAKFFFHFARPINWIRSHHPQGYANGVTNAHWTPLGQVASNSQASSRNTTPPFPSYPSGHAVFGAALFSAMRTEWGLDKDAPGPSFTFISDEFNGYNRDANGDLRPKVVRTFPSFTAAEAENARSRVWLGIHWQFDADDGITQGRSIGSYVAQNVYTAAP